jgi:hypothetical protein
LANHTIKILFLSVFIYSFSAKLQAQNEFPDTLSNKQDTSFVMKKSPWGAVLRSAILPGLGQFYNESYWKIPIVIGTIGALSYQWVDRNNLYKKYRDLFLETVKKDGTGNDQYRKIREFYKDQRDLVAVFIGLSYLLNLVDSYVDAHLFDFDVSENNNSLSLQLSLRINL